MAHTRSFFSDCDAFSRVDGTIFPRRLLNKRKKISSAARSFPYFGRRTAGTSVLRVFCSKHFPLRKVALLSAKWSEIQIQRAEASFNRSVHQDVAGHGTTAERGATRCEFLLPTHRSVVFPGKSVRPAGSRVMRR